MHYFQNKQNQHTDIAIKVQNLSKCYHIYDNPRDRLKQFVAPRLQRLVRPKQYFREFWVLKDCGTLNPTSGSLVTVGIRLLVNGLFGMAKLEALR